MRSYERNAFGISEIWLFVSFDLFRFYLADCRFCLDFFFLHLISATPFAIPRNCFDSVFRLFVLCNSIWIGLFCSFFVFLFVSRFNSKKSDFYENRLRFGNKKKNSDSESCVWFSRIVFSRESVRIPVLGSRFRANQWKKIGGVSVKPLRYERFSLFRFLFRFCCCRSVFFLSGSRLLRVGFAFPWNSEL